MLPWLAGLPAEFWLAAAFGLGAVVGSFLNVCIHRIPRGEEIVRTPSHCPSCGSRIPWYLNIPVLSWLVLRGRAACCGAPIPLHYPLVEAACGALSAYLLLRHGMALGFELLAEWLFSCLLLVLIVVDWRTLRLPDALTLPGTALGLIFAAVGVRMGIADALLGLAVGAGGFIGIAYLYKSTRGREGMGFGDVKLMAMIGAFLGWQKTLLVVVLGSVVGLVIGLVIIARGKEGMKTQLPYGTFLGLAAIFCLLWGDPILRCYASLFLVSEMPPVE